VDDRLCVIPVEDALQGTKAGTQKKKNISIITEPCSEEVKMIYQIKGGKRNGKRIEADFQDDNKLFKIEPKTVQDVAADGSVMTSKTFNKKPKLVFEAEKDEKIIVSE
jgi:hypothetical protein